METPKKKVVNRNKKYAVNVDAEAKRVEKEFRELSFGNQLRIASDTLTNKAIEAKSDFLLVSEHRCKDGAEFHIRVSFERK